MHFFSKSSLSQSALIFLFQDSFSSINGAYLDLRMSIINGLELLITFLRQAPSKNMWAHEQAGFQVTVPQSQDSLCTHSQRGSILSHRKFSAQWRQRAFISHVPYSCPCFWIQVLRALLAGTPMWQEQREDSCLGSKAASTHFGSFCSSYYVCPFAWLYSKPHTLMYLRKKVRGDKLGLEGDYKDASSYNMQLLPVSQLGHHSGFHCERDRLQVKRKEWQGHQGGSVS